MNIKRVIILYKRSAYSIYFKRVHSSLYKNTKVEAREIKRFRSNHDNHHVTLDAVERAVKSTGITCVKVCRGRNIEIGERELLITVGGDGTFLEGARSIKRQVILGVNSDPNWSVGRFCCATAESFPLILSELVRNKRKIRQFPRLELDVSGKTFIFLNDILFTHGNPAAMSRYSLKINSVSEEQKSSGVWISTAAGSSGAILSAGGKYVSPIGKIIQYKPRELYVSRGKKYRLKGGVLTSKSIVTIMSMMREGYVFLDGSHIALPVSFGGSIHIKMSRYPLNVVSCS